MTQLTFEPPSPDAPGFLRRWRQAVSFRDAIQTKKVTPQIIDDLTGFLSAWVVGVSQDEAKELLLDASKKQFLEMLDAISGLDDAKKNENGSSSGSKARRKRPMKP